MEVISIKRYRIGSLDCYGCGTELNLECLQRVELKGGFIVYVCHKCCERLAKICNIEIEEIEKPDIDECSTCMIKYRCFTTRV